MNEQELIQRLRQGDEPAFRWLVETYRNRVFHTALNILRDDKDAEDAAQETFIKVYESISSFRGESSLSTWIYRIAVHKALDKLRRKKSRQTLGRIIPWWMPEESKSSAENFQHPGVAAEQKEKAALLFRVIGSLPEKQKVAFFFKQWGTWGADKIKRNKKLNGKEIDGKIWQQYPENIEQQFAAV